MDLAMPQIDVCVSQIFMLKSYVLGDLWVLEEPLEALILWEALCE